MKKKKGIRVMVVMALFVVLAGSSYYYSIHYNRYAVWLHPDDLEKIVEIIKETDTEIQAVQETETAEEEPEWPKIVYTDFKPKSAFPAENTFCVYNSGEYLFLTQEGKNLTGDTYGKAYPFHEGLACVAKAGKYGYINPKGETAIPFVYDDAAPFMEGLAYFSRDGEYGFMDKTGEPKFYLDCDSVSQFVEGLAYFCIDGRYGYIDTNGDTVIEPDYDDAGYFKDGVAEVVKDSKRGIIDKTGREIVPTEYIEIEKVESCFLAKGENAYDVFDWKGNVLSRQEFDWAYDSSIYEQEELGNKEKGISGIICRGKLYKFDNYYNISRVIPEKRLVTVYGDDGKYGVIDFEGKIKIPVSYEEISYNEAGNVFVLQATGGKWGVLGDNDFTTWRVPLSNDYDSISSPESGKAMLMVEKGGKYGAISPDGEILIPIAFECSEVIDSIDDTDDMEAAIPFSYRLRQVVFEFSGIKVIAIRDDDYTIDGYAIVQTGDSKELPDCLFGNHITPRASVFLEFLQNGSFEVEDATCLSGFDTVQCGNFQGEEVICKFYDFDHTGNPVLYVYSSPYDSSSSHSGFFVREGEEVKCICSAYMTDERVGGADVCLWYDGWEGQLLYGKSGGFSFGYVEFDSYSIVYGYEEGFRLKSSIQMNSYSEHNQEYFVDGEVVSLEEHDERKELFKERYEYLTSCRKNYP